MMSHSASLSMSVRFRSPVPFALLALSALLPLPAVRGDDAGSAEYSGQSMPEIRLRQVEERQMALLDDARKQGADLDSESLRAQLQSIGHEYELIFREDPKNAEAYAAYGYLLRQIGMDKESVGLMLKANSLDPNMPLVKNEIGNYLAEQGKPLEAVSYFLDAIKLDPDQPLYHYQLGTLLYQARDEFIRSGDWTSESVDDAMQKAFKRAAELAPDRIEFTYRYAESFYSMPHPDWDQALKVWSQLEAKAESPIERQTMRLHEANILIKQRKYEDARHILSTVDVPELQVQRQKLVAQVSSVATK